jgi:hypothetical protein
MSFFITSLPRSRTQWFCHYYKAYGVPCSHELSTNAASVEEFKSTLGDGGDADWNLLNTPVLEMYPEAPVLIVLRDPEDVSLSLVNNLRWDYALAYNVFRSLYFRLQEYTGPNVMHVRFEDINNRIEEIHNWLTPDVPFNQELSESLLADTVHETMTSYDRDRIAHSSYMWRQVQPELYDTTGRLL